MVQGLSGETPVKVVESVFELQADSKICSLGAVGADRLLMDVRLHDW